MALEQIDKKRYNRREIAREDDMDIPFVNDERVLGDWKVFDFISNKDEFAPDVNHIPQDRLFFKHMHFEEEGFLTSVYLDETTFGKEIHCITCGETIESAVANALDAKKAWIEAALEDGIEIYEPDSLEDYSGPFKLQIPRSVHKSLAEHSKREGISMNQYCVYLLSRNDAVYSK